MLASADQCCPGVTTSAHQCSPVLLISANQCCPVFRIGIFFNEQGRTEKVVRGWARHRGGGEYGEKIV